MNVNRIRDIPKIQEPLKAARDILRFKQAFPRYEITIQELDIDVDIDRIRSILEDAELEGLTQRIEHLATLPDKFNDILGPEGWIIYGDMDIEVVETAVEYAETGDLEEAEAELITYYDREKIEWQLKRLVDIEAFRPRMDLAEKAVADYEAGRYHACVPVVLALLDGMVQQAYVDAYGESRGFSACDADLEAWDSIAGHPKGLEQLQDLMLQGRQQTRTDEISKPYRNGIMHGMDLGYDTDRVAAKSWAALFAASEWARKAENEELEAPDDDGEKPSVWETLIESLQTYEETQEVKQAIAEWGPRDIVVGADIPAKGASEDYGEDTPERALIEFLSHWEDGNYGGMAASIITKEGATEHPGDIREEFEPLDLRSSELVQVEDIGAARTDITVRIIVDRIDETVEEETAVTLVRTADDGGAAVPGHEAGTWTVTNREKLLVL